MKDRHDPRVTAPAIAPDRPDADPGIDAGGDVGIGIGPGLRLGQRGKFGDDQAAE